MDRKSSCARITIGTLRPYNSSDTILPRARIGSTLRLIMAAGATPAFMLCINVALDVLEPLPAGKTKILPVTFAPDSS